MRPTISACRLVICIWPRQAAVVHSLDWPTFVATSAHLMLFFSLRKAIRSVTSVRCIGFISELTASSASRFMAASSGSQVHDLARRLHRPAHGAALVHAPAVDKEIHHLVAQAVALRGRVDGMAGPPAAARGCVGCRRAAARAPRPPP